MMIFMLLKPKPGEATQGFVIRLREAATDCGLGESSIVDNQVREQTLMNGNNNKLRRKAMKNDWDL